MANLDTTYFCKFCNHKTSSLLSKIHHAHAHRHLSAYFHCGLGHCASTFKTEAGLRMHVIRNHKIFVSHAVRPTSVNIINHLNDDLKYQCPIVSCSQRFFMYKEFTKHLKDHLRSGKSVPCPFSASKGCTNVSQTWNSLTGHLSRKHKNECCERIPARPSFTVGPIEPLDSIPDVETLFTQDELNEYCATTENNVQGSLNESLVTVAQFYQKLEYKHMVPASVTQVISVEMKTMMMDLQRCMLSSLNSALGNEGLSVDSISRIVDSVKADSNNIFEVWRTLRTTYMRKKFYENNFCFVEPLKLPLPNGSTFYYIPLAQTIKAAFRNKSWSFGVSSSSQPHSGLYKDFKDGSAFKENIFFQENPDALPLILYQDAFQCVCPIGPAKNLKHKILGIYLAFGNLPPEVRFKKGSIQLVALCSESDFDHEAIYGRIVQDLLDLQTDGIDIPGVGFVKAGLAFISGDNLGSHCLAGMLTNFSRAHYFCRYCLLTRKVFNKPGGEVHKFKKRTVESYNHALHKLKSLPKAKRIKSGYHGIRFDSEFNKVRGFHVMNGLPACSGHDWAEGIICHDLKLYIKYFISKGWFTLEQLNQMIEKFPYCPEDRKDRPVIIKKLQKNRIAGGAWQVWNTLRLFPLIVHGYVKNVNDPVWQLLLQLRDLSEFVFAPEIHESYLAWFQCTIYEYLATRRKLFPNVPLRAKHHFATHAAEQILLFGPSTKVWTLRFETKHSFFNKSWRSANNSINFLKTLSYKHEFFQSWLRSGGGFECDFGSGARTPLKLGLYPQNVKDVLKSSNVRNVDVCEHVTLKGTSYKKGNIVILGTTSPIGDAFNVGIIHLILIDSLDLVTFFVKKAQLVFKYQVGMFKVSVTSNEYQCVRSKDLLCYYPLSPYVKDTETFVALRHAVVNTPVEL
ncbi:uncharacterized protein LOC117642862 [Thrips palmi]|uniref:Uncharacterized protein LOC117642862 n=1 Tax=Thrips palmi TaxID=161013 RepID=A0A6P8ZKM3_THRPL|nr:uncharacterized protein LOC117642862 [Thrips palmi]